jgi:multiple sugar transport system ATP-binding protein
MRGDLKQLHQSLATTMIYVTHDQVEAMTLGHRVAVMDRGRLQQLAAPEVVYRQPANLFVARFFGSTPINLVTGRLSRDETGWRFDAGNWSWAVRNELVRGSSDWIKSPVDVIIGFRAEDLYVIEAAHEPSRVFATGCRVRSIDHLGDVNVVHVEVPFGPGGNPAARSLDDTTGSSFSDSTSWTLKLTDDFSVKIGDRLDLAIRADRVMWFDPKTGNNLNG